MLKQVLSLSFGCIVPSTSTLMHIQKLESKLE